MVAVAPCPIDSACAAVAVAGWTARLTLLRTKTPRIGKARPKIATALSSQHPRTGFLHARLDEARLAPAFGIGILDSVHHGALDGLCQRNGGLAHRLHRDADRLCLARIDPLRRRP